MFDTSFTGVLLVFYMCVTGVCHRCFAGVLQVCYRCYTGVLQVYMWQQPCMCPNCGGGGEGMDGHPGSTSPTRADSQLRRHPSRADSQL